MKKIVKNTLALTLITVVLGLVLGLVHEITLEPIAAQERRKQQEAYAEVLPDAESFEELGVLRLAAGELRRGRHHPDGNPEY